MTPSATSTVPGDADTWTQAPADLLAALAEASEICTDESTRYALNCMQLRAPFTRSSRPTVISYLSGPASASPGTATC